MQTALFRVGDDDDDEGGNSDDYGDAYDGNDGTGKILDIL